MRKALWRAVRAVVAALSAVPWGDFAQGAAILGGWALLTWGVASLLVWEVWPISGGVFLLCFAGWDPLRMLFRKGVYAWATEPEDSAPSAPRPRLKRSA